jgi:hypothetical protein
MDAYLEVGKSRTFAAALDWPGWCRSGRDADAAQQALLDYAPRYARVLKSTRLGFKAPAKLKVVEHLKGDATTDFGSPGVPPEADAAPVDEAELRRLESVLKACWRAFDATIEAARGKALEKGPRGGGRELDDIVSHVLDADSGYLYRVASKVEPGPERLARTRTAILAALTAAAHGEVPEQGPRGGKRWSARYFVRRVAWHVLDHTWEIEDRVR